MPTTPVAQPLPDSDVCLTPAPLSASTRHAPRYRDIGQLAAGDELMRDLVERGKRLIDRGIPVLILGETGTGKEYLARALHDYSARRRASWIAINCASIPESLAESELFGYAKGAFSGALPGGMKGKVQQADGGTLFLDEIGDMPFALQTRLLRVLSEREVIPLGALRPVPVDVQLICATHQDLKTLVAEGRFREDLYYRIAGGVLRLPALRDRSDRPALVMQMIADELGHAADESMLDPAALQRLLAYPWPGNLRQLHAVIRYSCAVMNDGRITLRDLPEELMQFQPATLAQVLPLHRPASRLAAGSSSQADAADPGRDERTRVIEALNGSRWNISAASRQLGMCRASLYRKLRQLDIPHVRDQAMPAHAAYAVA
ncbi:sigma 54-interacting transcriptional regulator [Herbaspirillum huttiense F1]|jgi:Transcriptional activator of acetoin/glycerol metabolism|uniref:sigma-54-dependent Fis family transcriptional regulator n=1 Tax=Herbaspirillum TaxID=963 RepID=UPI001066EB1E|nr:MULTISPECIES: sigma 54-interacting transcriptional regulator [Herbaspirillum]MBP1316990.1 transcriptional regulator of acetoin/glycerol metabolism [Herbaspirillum sp. 1130]MDR6740279.1 transcriptional regulator of acetoin/glycerol metabolism [Herbaspirillum sp. 1173]MDT0356116.1 sigma 54-interacting transcriptional regulator [Herbaspirillum huttiense F1]